MPIEDASYSTLTNIIRKVRRITSSPSSNQITDADIQHYINTFVLYSFPEDIKLFNLKKTLKFFTQPDVDVYATNLVDATDPLYNFRNKYSFTGEPAYINGIRSMFTQDRSQFFRLYPFSNYSNVVGTGDGSNTIFSGVLSSIPVLKNNVLFTSIDANNNGIIAQDDGSGNLLQNGVAIGTIDYITGAYSFTYTSAPGLSQDVKSKTVPYNRSIPSAILYFDNCFTIRPVPDEVYAISLEVYQRPDALLTVDSMPELTQHWEYIAYGAAKKIFEDRRDQQSKMEISETFRELEEQVRAKSTMQLSEQRASTIYEDKSYFGNWNFPFGWRY